MRDLLYLVDAALQESLDSPVEWRWDDINTQGISTANFHIDDRQSTVYLIRMPEGSVFIAFIVSGQSIITGLGSAPSIFSTVIEIMQDYLDRSDCDHFFFYSKSDEPSRVKLYRGMSRRLARSFGFTAKESKPDKDDIGYDEGTVRFDLHRNAH